MSDAAHKLTSTSGASAASTRQMSSSSRAVGMLLFAGAVVGGSYWYVQQHDRAIENERAATEASVAPKYTVHLEGFTVNLSDPEETHFLRVTIDLGIDRLPPGTDKEKPGQAIPVARIRDSILSVLTVCKANELLTPEGKEQLKKNLLETLRKNVPELALREIYFTEFLVQR